MRRGVLSCLLEHARGGGAVTAAARRRGPAPFYRFSRFVVWILFRTLWRLRIEGAENVPPEGAVIVAPNHRSLADPPLIGCGVRREVHFLAKKELFRFGPFGRLISNLNAHPLNRAAGSAAFKTALKILHHGDILIMFPEGRRAKTDELGVGKAGVAMLARRTRTPVVPAYIHNSGYVTRFRRLRVRFGEPIDPSGFADDEPLAAEVMRRIGDLKAAVLADEK